MTPDDLRKLQGEMTGGPWSAGHMCKEDHPCQCRYIFSGNHMGSIAIMSEGGTESDNPLESEQIANARAIAMTPDLIAEVLRLQAENEALRSCAGIIRNDTAAIARAALRTPGT